MTTSELTTQELEQRLAEAQEKIKELEVVNKKKGIVLKVSDKGCVQINGIRKFPITFYKQEFEKIFDMKDEIEAFIEENSSKLSTK